MAHNINQPGTARTPNLSLHIPNADPPRRQSTTTTPLPADVASARRNRINKDLLSLFQRPAPRRSTPSSATPPYIKGIGLYTHAEVPSPPHDPSFPQQHPTQSAPRREYLPLGGFRGVSRRGGLKPDLPEDVKAVYEQVREVVRREEKESKHAGQRDPKERYGALGVPHVVASRRSEEEGSEDMDLDVSAGMELGEMRDEEEAEKPGERRPSVAGAMQDLRVGGRRPSTLGDVSMGSTDGDSTSTAAPAPASTATQKSGVAASTAPAAERTKSGSIYDPSRDPRKRCR